MKGDAAVVEGPRSAPRRRVGAAASVLLALVLLPAPLLPPNVLVRGVEAAFGVGRKAAYLAAAVGLHAVVYGTLGLLGAFVVGPGLGRRAFALRLLVVPTGVVALGLLVRAARLGHLPVLANALVGLTAALLGVLLGLLHLRHGGRATGIAVLLLAALVASAFLPSGNRALHLAAQERLRALVAAGPAAGTGDSRFGALLRAAFTGAGEHAEETTEEEGHAALLALGVALGHERLARHLGLAREDALVNAAVLLRPGTTLQGREDWVRHFCLSAALAVVHDSFLSDVGGVWKEELDALAGGSGFSFADLAADRAGVRFAEAVTASQAAAAAARERLHAPFRTEDYLPPLDDLPENLTTEAFRARFGGVGDPRYRRLLEAIETALDRCAALKQGA